MKGIKLVSRREFLKWSGVAATSLFLNACRKREILTPITTVTLISTEKSQPLSEPSMRRGNLEDAAIYYLGYATDENLDWVEEFEIDVLTRGFLLFLNSNDTWIPAYRPRMLQCQDSGRLFLVAMQAAVLVEDIRNIPELSDDDPAMDFPMDTIPQWESYACHTPEGLSKNKGFAHSCLNNKDFRTFLMEKLRALIDSGADGVHIDELNTRYFALQEGYCDACTHGFRDYLSAKFGQSELESLYGITSISTFNFRDQLAEEGNLQKPPESPLHKEWWLFQLSNLATAEKEVLSFCQNYAKQLGTDFLVNSNAFEPESNPERLIEMTLTDYSAIGTGLNINLRVNGKITSQPRIPPLYSYIPVYRLAKSVTPQKPVTLFIDGPGGTGVIKEFSEPNQEAIVSWMFSEANAAGAHFHVPYPSLDYYAPLETCQRYSRFIRDNWEIFQGATHLVDVGVLFSFASEIWDYWISPSSNKTIHHRQWYGLCQALTDLSIQYEVVFAPDGVIIPGDLTLSDLQEFHTLIVPWAYSFSNEIETRLRDFVSSGRNLIILGDFGLTDEENRERESLLSDRFRRLGAEVIPVLNFEAYLNDPQGRHEPPVLEVLSNLVPEKIVTVSNSSITALINRADDTICTHLINKDLVESGFKPQSNTLVKIKLPQEIKITSVEVTYLSPDQGSGDSVHLPLEQNSGGIEVLVPYLDVYGVLVIPVEGRS